MDRPPPAADAAAFAGDADRVQSARRLVTASSNPALDRLAELAARLLGAPAAQVSLLSDVQTISAAVGTAAGVPTPLADSLCTVTATSAEPLVVTDALADARVSGLPPVTSGAVRAYLGVPLRGQDGHVVGALCVFGPDVREWAGSDVSLLTALATSAVTELELSALSVDLEAVRVRHQLAVSAGGVGTFDWDLGTGSLTWDENLLQMFGYAADDFGRTIEAFNDRVHPDDRARVARALQESIDTVGPYDAEYRIVLPGGTTRWVRAKGQSLADESGRAARVLGAAYDTTAARDEDARIARVLESMSSAFFSLDREFRFSHVNGEAERVLGRSRTELLGGCVWELFPEAVGSEFERHYRAVAETGVPATFEAYYPAPLDAWFEVRAWSDPDGLSVSFLDVTERMRAQRALGTAHAATADAAERLRLIVRVSEDLSSTLDVEEAYARLAQHLVPALGDWCLVTLVDEDGGLRDLGCQHADPAAATSSSSTARRACRRWSRAPTCSACGARGSPPASPRVPPRRSRRSSRRARRRATCWNGWRRRRSSACRCVPAGARSGSSASSTTARPTGSRPRTSCWRRRSATVRAWPSTTPGSTPSSSGSPRGCSAASSRRPSSRTTCR